jgi:hypothetical protein
MYSTGFATRPLLMLASSQRDSFSRLRVLSANRLRQSRDMLGTVRGHRSARPASTGLVGSGTVRSAPIGMKRASRLRYSLPPRRSPVRLKTSRKWSSKKKTQTYQSVIRPSSTASHSGWV